MLIFSTETDYVLQKISGHAVRIVVAGTIALFVAHSFPLVVIYRLSIPTHAEIVNVSGNSAFADMQIIRNGSFKPLCFFLHVPTQ